MSETTCEYLPRSPVPEEISDLKVFKADVLIIGSGPVGATFARKILDKSKLKVLMVDIGVCLSSQPGVNLKNSAYYQKNVNPFTNVVKGHLHKLSVPVDKSVETVLDPFCYSPPYDKRGTYEISNQNPDQDPSKNLSGAEATYAVGGMGTHWTCSVPRTNPELERSSLISNEEWDNLYEEAEGYLKKTQSAFDSSIRQTVVRETLQKEYGELSDSKYKPQNLPLSVHRRKDKDNFYKWGSAAFILGEYASQSTVDPAEETEEQPMGSRRFVIKEQRICRRLVFDENEPTKIRHAVVENLLHGTSMKVLAKRFVICGGTVLGAQLLYASNIRPQALGRYLTEQPLAFCQVVLSRDKIESIREDQRFKKDLDIYQKLHPNDPVPIPLNDPDPQCWIPVSSGRPWHCQIHRDAFAFGDTAPHIDQRLVVDFRWFGLVKQVAENRVTFSDKNHDIFGMPQPTFYFEESTEFADQNHEMLHDMVRATKELGGYLPGSYPQFMQPGTSLHMHGHTRIGEDPKTSVADRNCKVWDTDNLWIGGCGCIDTAIACNPTLTACALAIKAVNNIMLVPPNE